MRTLQNVNVYMIPFALNLEYERDDLGHYEGARNR